MNHMGPPLRQARSRRDQLKRLRAIGGVLFSLVCVAFIGRQLWIWREEIGNAFHLQPATLILLGLLTACAHAQRAGEFNYMLRRLSVRERYWDSFLLAGMTLLLNYLPFSAGSATRAVALRHKHELPYASYLSALVISALVNAQVAATLGFIMCLLVLPRGGAHELVVALFGVAAVGGGLALLAPTSRVPRGDSWLARHARQWIEGLRLIRGRGGLLVLAAFSLAKLSFNTARLWLCFRTLGIALPPEYAALFGSSAVIIGIVNIVPGNLGLRELLVGLLSGSMGFTARMGMAAASLDRTAIMTYTLLAGVPCLLGIRRAFKKEPEPAVPNP